MKNKVRILVEYDLLSSAISTFVALLAVLFTGKYNPFFFFIFIFPFSFVVFRYDPHRHYLLKWFYVHFEWRFHFE